MPTTNDTEADESNRTTTSDAPLGTAEVVLDVSPETYERPHKEYCRAIDEGNPLGLDYFLFNRTATGCYVTVDGEPVDVCPRSTSTTNRLTHERR
jgi:hypothetical protein